MELVPAGEYVAKVIDYGIVGSKTGEPMATAKLETDKGSVFWNSLLRKAPEGKRNFAIEALIAMGLKSVQDIEKLADGPSSGVLDQEQPVRIVVIHEEFNGKVYAKVQWVNRAGGNSFKNMMSKEELKTKLPDLRSDFVAAYQINGPVGAQKPVAAASEIKIPF